MPISSELFQKHAQHRRSYKQVPSTKPRARSVERAVEAAKHRAIVPSAVKLSRSLSRLHDAILGAIKFAGLPEKEIFEDELSFPGSSRHGRADISCLTFLVRRIDVALLRPGCALWRPRHRIPDSPSCLVTFDRSGRSADLSGQTRMAIDGPNQGYRVIPAAPRRLKIAALVIGKAISCPGQRTATSRPWSNVIRVM